ncbi:enoyl-CoA hydratase/isomerase family protein [Streptomyces sp. TRM70350]|uniref:enoyl-CoA hydratase/isomerase family protein n=1 Tax=Streptomyces sp. TRM70350 TaxID=2856165 RepID=UPI001C48CB86|nr:enoyl-CoA hydratase/isomerase family protein [Streptomyces sp. TRM70350]MBV7700851.1 enoyl-CoA hydratase/isomerase family protein [Streptomyces sp. TRM70350]
MSEETVAHAPGTARSALEQDARALTAQLAGVRTHLDRLPQRPDRSAAQQHTARRLLAEARAAREEFLGRHVREVYATLTEGLGRVPRVAELLAAAARHYPGLVPAEADLAADRAREQRAKEGWEIDQGIFVAHVLGDRPSGRHLLHAMTRPRQRALRLLDEFHQRDAVDLGPVAVHHKNGVGHVTFQNHRYLNAEDDASNQALEIAVDLVLLDDRIDVGVLRGGTATHPKWAGRRVFGAGINLTHLRQGRISLVDFFLDRELCAVNKMYRGHSGAFTGEAEPRSAREKPWIATVDAFAIGGGCQFLLVMDHVVAQKEAYVNLPAGREGIIPGCGVLRLPRFVGEQLARQAVLFNRDIPVDSPEGRMIVSEALPAAELDAATDRAVEGLRAMGTTSVLANRRALRMSVEPQDAFRRYMANYAREQGYCAHSQAVTDNLDRTWAR